MIYYAQNNVGNTVSHSNNNSSPISEAIFCDSFAEIQQSSCIVQFFAPYVCFAYCLESFENVFHFTKTIRRVLKVEIELQLEKWQPFLPVQELHNSKCLRKTSFRNLTVSFEETVLTRP